MSNDMKDLVADRETANSKLDDWRRRFKYRVKPKRAIRYSSEEISEKLKLPLSKPRPKAAQKQEIQMFKKNHPEIGSRPGTLVLRDDAPPPVIRVVQYSRQAVFEHTVRSVEDIKSYLRDDQITWIEVRGLGDESALQALANAFEIHPLALEDVVNTPQPPKSELYQSQQLIISRHLSLVGDLEMQMEQVSIILGPNYVITFQESHREIFEPVRRRLRLATARLRTHGPDYLAYALLDLLIDAYYPVLETLGEHIELLDDIILEHPTPQLLKRINLLKNRLVDLRRGIWPQRESVHSIYRDENELISEPVRVYLRDTHDHCVQTSEVVEMYRDMATGLLNMYLSSVGHRTNEVMRVLTIMSSIFIPLTFLAGIYGMNFENMPELKFQWAYPMVWIAMIGMVAGMVVFFYRKGWLVSGQSAVPISRVADTLAARQQPVVSYPSNAREPSLKTANEKAA